MRSDFRPVMGEVDYTITPDEYSMPIEEYLNKNFGAGSWVHDSVDDKFVVWDEDYDGPGLGYIVVDRELNHQSATVRPGLLN